MCYARHNGHSLITGQQAGQSTRDAGPVLAECCASISDAGTTFTQRWAAVPCELWCHWGAGFIFMVCRFYSHKLQVSAGYIASVILTRTCRDQKATMVFFTVSDERACTLHLGWQNQNKNMCFFSLPCARIRLLPISEINQLISGDKKHFERNKFISGDKKDIFPAMFFSLVFFLSPSLTFIKIVQFVLFGLPR